MSEKLQTNDDFSPRLKIYSTFELSNGACDARGAGQPDQGPREVGTGQGSRQGIIQVGRARDVTQKPEHPIVN